MLDLARTAAALPGGTGMPERVRALVSTVLERVRDHTSGDRPGRLLVLTHNATGEDPDPAESAVAALVRSAQSEHPGRIVLADQRGTPASGSALAAALRSGEPQVALDAGAVLVPRLLPADPPAEAPPALGPEGTVLVTGGTGALGASLVRYLVADHGVRHLLLTNRSGRTPEWAAEVPAEVQVSACDMGDRDAVHALVASCGPALRAVFHLAGALDDGVVDTMTPDRLAAVLAPKADGAWYLHEATRDLGLSDFVLYSSAAGVLGRPGQSNYAAANGFLDALARHRAAHGLPARALAWGPWTTAGEAGMAGGIAPVRLVEGGVLPVTEREGIALLDTALRTPEPVLVPLRLDRAAASRSETSPVLADLLPAPAPRTEPTGAPVGQGGDTPAAQAPGSWRERLAAVAEPQREAVLAELIRAEVAAVLGFPDTEALPADRPFTDLGFDSLTAVQVRNRLSAFTRVRLAPTVVLEHPTPARLAAHIHAALVAAGAIPLDEAERETRPETAAPTPYHFSSLYHHVLRDKGPFEAMGLRHLASYALPVFSGAERARYTVPPVPLAQGDGTPVVYIPDYLSSHYRVPHALAERLDGKHDVFLLEHPGLGERRGVPDGMETVVRAHADTVRALPLDAPPVLVGFCAGGVIAHAAARYLAESGRPPAGVVLIDTHSGVLRRDDPRGLALMAAGTALPDDVVAESDDSLLIAGGGYARVLEDWHPEPSPVPTLLLRGRPTAEMRRIDPDADWQPHWPLPHDAVDLAGDHHSALHRDAGSTAAAIRAWLTRMTEAANPRRGDQR